MSEKLPRTDEEKGPEYWADMALRKALLFIPKIDKGLRVSVVDAKIAPNRLETYSATVLHFSHGEHAYIDWTMDVGESENWIENEFENVVRKIYNEKVKDYRGY
jgi:hypothetical protein